MKETKEQEEFMKVYKEHEKRNQERLLTSLGVVLAVGLLDKA